MSNSYSEKYRPKKPNQLIGQHQIAIASTLLGKVETDDIIQEVLFTGPSGVGKTTIGRMYIQSILSDLDIDNNITVVNCSADTGIDFIRETIIANMAYLPMHPLKYQIYFLDEIHGLSKSAQNSLLVSIEPLPKHVIMIGSTTEPEKLIPTLRSRFTEYKLQKPSQKEFEKLAGWILKSAEKNKTDLFEEINVTKQTISEIISVANGNVRTFVRYIQQAIEGSYKGYQEEEPEKRSLIYKILYGNASLTEWFKAAELEENYVGSIAQMGHYAIKVIAGNSNQKVKNRASLILKHLGNGLNGKTSEKVEFYHKLVMMHEDIA